MRWQASASSASTTSGRANIELDLAETSESTAREQVERICKDLLANTVIENYAYELVR